MPSRRLRIEHRSGYRYAAPVQASFNEVRMTPINGEGQLLISHSLDITPAAAVSTYIDYWGAVVASFDVHASHRMLEIVSTSLVDTAGGHARAPGLAWRAIHDSSVADRWCEFLAPSPFVDDPRDDPARAGIVEDMAAMPTPADAVAEAVAAVRDRIRYTPGVTDVSTTAGQAWASGHGVCQDFSHATLALLRAVGIPARYVSGYLHDEEESLGATVHGESHAWVEVWDGGWEAFDPTNDRRVGSAHVTVARGRDYSDVPPLKGIYAGGRSEALGVSVQITQLPR